MINENLENLKKELGLENMTNREILEYSLRCSQEIRLELTNESNKVGNQNLINTLCKADELILNELVKFNIDDTRFRESWGYEVSKMKVG